MSYLFRNRTTRQTKRCEQNFDFQPTARENKAGRRDWPGVNQNCGISTILKKGTPLKSGAGRYFVHLFDTTHPKGFRGTPRSWEG